MVPQPDGAQLKFKANSFSGSEPNRLFINADGNFLDVSFLSGLAHKGDGRGFAVLDYDNDGWQDIALVSTNRPMLQLYRNRVGTLGDGGCFVRIKLVGKNQSPKPSASFSNRDGIGTKVCATYKSGRTRIFQKAVGEGNVAQNSDLMHIGFSKSDPVTSLAITWPSGRRKTLNKIVPEETMVISED